MDVDETKNETYVHSRTGSKTIGKICEEDCFQTKQTFKLLKTLYSVRALLPSASVCDTTYLKLKTNLPFRVCDIRKTFICMVVDYFHLFVYECQSILVKAVLRENISLSDKTSLCSSTYFIFFSLF